MDKIVFKRDIMYLPKDKYEIRRTKKKSVLDFLLYVYTSKLIFGLLIIPVFMLMMFLMNMPIKGEQIIPFVSSFCVFTVAYYCTQRKNVDISIENIKRIYLGGNKTLRIEYKDGNSQRTRIIDLPNDYAERELVLDQMREAAIPVDNRGSFTEHDKSKFYKFNLYAGIIVFFINIIFLLAVLNISGDNSIVVILLIFLLFFCGIGALYVLYKSKNIKNN